MVPTATTEDLLDHALFRTSFRSGAYRECLSGPCISAVVLLGPAGKRPAEDRLFQLSAPTQGTITNLDKILNTRNHLIDARDDSLLFRKRWQWKLDLRES